MLVRAGIWSNKLLEREGLGVIIPNMGGHRSEDEKFSFLLGLLAIFPCLPFRTFQPACLMIAPVMEVPMDDHAVARHIERLEAIMADLDADELSMPAIHVSAAIDSLWKIARSNSCQRHRLPQGK